MSEELEWELFEVFENALFAFPIYDHKSARQIVHYLLRRGVLEEEIADAIEDSTIDLMIWLNRGGKHMVGEWVISWINETRDEYQREVEIERMHLEELNRDITPGRSIATSESGDTEDLGSEADVVRGEETQAPEAGGVVPLTGDEDSGVLGSDDDGSPLLQPPTRTLRRKWSRKGREPPTAPHPDPELGQDGEPEVARHHSPPSDTEDGATGLSSQSTLYSSIPSDLSTDATDHGLCMDTSDHGICVEITDHSRSAESSDREACSESPDPDRCMDTPDQALSDQSLSSDTIDQYMDQAVVTVVTQTDHNQNQKCSNCTLATRDVFKVDKDGLPVKSQCTCTLAHYSYIRQLREAEETFHHTESPDRALEINVDTLDKDGPGFIFIMTDSLRECMPWSAESRYKVASSRRPERCLLEFRSRNVDIDLIWQVKVEHHVMAVREVHKTLTKYNLHSNWFRCSLSEIMEAISKVIKKYKHK